MAPSAREDESIRAYETALQLTEDTLKANPRDARAWHRKGQILSNLGRDEDALQALREKFLSITDQILVNDAKNASALRMKAEALITLDRWDESLQALEKVIEINPGDYNALSRKGELLQMMGRFNESLQAFDRAIELIPANDTLELAAHWSAKYEVLQRAGRLDEAIAALDKVTELDSQNALARNDAPENWYRRGMELGNNGSYEEAIKAYEKSIELNQSFTPALVRQRSSSVPSGQEGRGENCL